MEISVVRISPPSTTICCVKLGQNWDVQLCDIPTHMSSINMWWLRRSVNSCDLIWQVAKIKTMIHYPYLLHKQTLFRLNRQVPLPSAEHVGRRIFSLPLYPELTEDEVTQVARAIIEFENVPSRLK